MALTSFPNIIIKAGNGIVAVGLLNLGPFSDERGAISPQASHYLEMAIRLLRIDKSNHFQPGLDCSAARQMGNIRTDVMALHGCFVNALPNLHTGFVAQTTPPRRC